MATPPSSSAAEQPRDIRRIQRAPVARRQAVELQPADAAVVDTTWLTHLQVLTDFLDYNDYLNLADAAGEAWAEGYRQLLEP